MFLPGSCAGCGRRTASGLDPSAISGYNRLKPVMAHKPMVPAGAPARAAAREYLKTHFVTDLPPGWPEKYGIVTAYNPNGQPATEAENVEADSRLKQRLNALGLRHFRVTGTSKDGAHQEPGFGIVAENREQISELAREKQRLRHSRMETGIVESRRFSVQKTTCAKDFADDGQNRAY